MKTQTQTLDKLALRGSKLTKWEQVIPLTVLGIIVVTLIIFVRPRLQELTTYNQTLKAKQDEAAQLAAKNEFLSKMNSEVDTEQINKQLDQAGQFLPNYKPSLEILLNIIRLVKYEQLEFGGLSLEPGLIKDRNTVSTPSAQPISSDPSSTGDLDSFEISFTVTGEKEVLLDFLVKMREISPLMKIEKFALAVRRNEQNPEEKNPPLSLNFTNRIYYQRGLPPIPVLSSTMNTLNEDEKKFLKELEDYLFLQPEFTAGEPDINSFTLGVENPFAANHQE